MSGSGISHPCVVDTNVVLVANGQQPAVAGLCVEACIRALLAVQAGRQRVVVDDADRILGEYRHKTKPWSRQPKTGDIFVKWVHDYQYDRSRCDRVTLHPKANDPQDFEEFPADAALATFERADRKFVAVAKAHAEQPPILEAADTDFWYARQALAVCGVKVEFLCPNDIQRLAARKQKKS